MAMIEGESSKCSGMYSVVNKDISQRKSNFLVKKQADVAFILIPCILLSPHTKILVFRIMDHIRYSSNMRQCQA
jgi:hypothetical protein